MKTFLTLSALIFLCLSLPGMTGPRSIDVALKKSKLSMDGLGPLRIGMSLKAVQATGFGLDMAGDETDSCLTAAVKTYKEISLMFEKGILTRVEISGPSLSTLSGVRVGHTEAQVHKIYGARIVVEPHKYDDKGHYMKLFSSDRKKALVLETDGTKVTNMLAGYARSAQYVEGCL